MPIDFGRIVALYQAPLHYEVKTIRDSFERLALWIQARTKQVEPIELATRGFPAIDFYNDALTLRVAPFQLGRLAPWSPGGGTPPSLWERTFGAGGLGRVAVAIREELVLPTYLGTFSEMLEAIVDSIRRYDLPKPEMFDLLTPRRLSDIFGQAVLFLRAIPTSRAQIHALLTYPPLVAFMQAPASGGGGGSDGGKSMRDLVSYLVGAIVLVPAAGAWIAALAKSYSLAIKALVLEKYEAIEAKVFRVRRSVVDLFFVGLRGLGMQALDFARSAAHVFVKDTAILLRFVRIYGRGLISGIRAYIGGMSRYLRYWTIVIEAIRGTIDSIMDHDLGADIAAALGIPGFLVPRLTLDDIFSFGTGLGTATIRTAWSVFLGALDHWPINRIPGVGPRIGPLREFINLLFSSSPSFEEAAPPPRFRGRFPDIGAAFFGPGAPDIRDAIRQLGARAADDVMTVLDSGAAFLSDAGRQFSEAATGAAMLGSTARYRQLARQADAVAESAFGDQRRDLLKQIAERRDPLAEAFDAAIAAGGFHIIGAAIPLYVEAMRQYWDRERPEDPAPAGETPVSPHILARRARVGRVKLPALTIRAQGRALDDALISTIAVRFKEAIERAYVTGLGRLDGTAIGGAP